jgi:hypothetical protein
MEACVTVSEGCPRKDRNLLMISERLPGCQDAALGGDLPNCAVLMLEPGLIFRTRPQPMAQQQVEMGAEPAATLSWQGVLSCIDPGFRGTNPLMIIPNHPQLTPYPPES